MSLPELLIAAVLGVFVLGGAVTVLAAAGRDQPAVANRAAEIQQARALAERITREARQGSLVTVASSTQLTLLTYVHRSSCGGDPAPTAIQCRVTYACSAGVCTRTERQPNGAGTSPAVRLVEGLSSSAVFSYSPTAVDPAHIGMRFVFPAESGSDAITLEDGVALRNPAAPSA